MLETTTCPGCHIGCSLEDPQCARGLEVFRAMWLRGEELPLRRKGRPPQSARNHNESGRDGKPGSKIDRKGCAGPRDSQDEKLVFLLTEVVPRSLAGVNGSGEERLLAGLSRQGGGMSRQVMTERTRVGGRDLDDAIASLLEDELIEESRTETGSCFCWITEKGRLAVEGFEAKRRQAIVERLACLDSADKQQLERIVDKLLAAGHGPAPSSS